MDGALAGGEVGDAEVGQPGVDHSRQVPEPLTSVDRRVLSWRV
ncbi:MAG: hypothetical protein S0880_19120 [Actinomycetota bacterium]|nr:hypothetical protein [Actinomycetota bacterium]